MNKLRYTLLAVLAFASAAFAQVTIPWNQVSKTGSNLNQFPTRNFSDLQNKPTTLAGYGITDSQAIDPTLTAWGGVTFAADKLGYATAADTFATTDFTSVSRTLLGQSTLALWRTGIGLGTGDSPTFTGLTLSNALTGANGGTGVANTGKTITLGGNVTTIGAFNLTFTQTGNTTVTLPTTGTLATLAGSEALTNKTYAGSTATLSSLTAGRVTFAGASGLLADDADLTFATDTLTATKGTFGGITHVAGAITAPTGSPLTLAGADGGASLVLGQGATAGDLTAMPTGTGGLGIGSKPVAVEQVNLWSKISSGGGSTGVLRAAQFCANYTGANAFTALDLVADGQGGTYDHSVALQAYTKNTGTGNVTHMMGLNLQGAHTGSGTVTTADAIYWGGWSGGGTYTNRWFINAGASADNSWLGGGLNVVGKFVNGPGPTGNGTFGTYQGYINGINPVWEWANGATTTAFMGTGSVFFSGSNVNDFGIMQNAAARSIILGVNAEKTVTISKTNVALASTASLVVAGTSPSTSSTTGALQVAGGIYAGAASVFGGSVSVSSLALTTALAVAHGGTGQTTYTDGQLLIGNSTGNTLTKATLTAGVGVTITNDSGSITIKNSQMSTLRTADATLVGGTATITDAATTANTIIRLSYKTPGGVPGAVYVSSKTASTGFVITSTNVADTGVVYYEAFEP